MRPDDFARFRSLITGMAKLYEREIDQTLLDAYWISLQDWDIDDLERAAGHLMATSGWMPRPSAFNDLRKQAKTTPGEAWLAVLEHCSSGRYRDGSGIDGGGPIDRAVLVAGGYRAVALQPEDRLHFIERRFGEAYEAYEARDEAVLALGGPQGGLTGKLGKLLGRTGNGG